MCIYKNTQIHINKTINEHFAKNIIIIYILELVFGGNCIHTWFACVSHHICTQKVALATWLAILNDSNTTTKRLFIRSSALIRCPASMSKPVPRIMFIRTEEQSRRTTKTMFFCKSHAVLIFSTKVSYDATGEHFQVLYYALENIFKFLIKPQKIPCKFYLIYSS